MPLRKRTATSKHGYNSMGCLSIVTARYGWVGLGTGGVEVFSCRECKKVRRSRGTENNEEESLIHFLGLAFGP